METQDEGTDDEILSARGLDALAHKRCYSLCPQIPWSCADAAQL